VLAKVCRQQLGIHQLQVQQFGIDVGDDGRCVEGFAVLGDCTAGATLGEQHFTYRAGDFDRDAA
jgi:hypothetical protein